MNKIKRGVSLLLCSLLFGSAVTLGNVADVQAGKQIKTETKQADAERLMAVMALGICHGQTITVETVGPDEKEAAEAVQDFFQAKL